MFSRPLPKDFKSYIPFIIYLLLFAFLMPSAAKFEYDYKKGSPWNYETLVSEFDFPLYKSEDQMLEEYSRLSSEVVPYYRLSEAVEEECLKQLVSAPLDSCDSLRNVLVASLKAIYQKDILPDEAVRIDNRFASVSKDFIYIQKDKRADKYPSSEVLKLDDAKARLLALVDSQTSGINADSLLRAALIYDMVRPNLQYDAQMTEMVHSETEETVSPTQGFVRAGTVIVSKDEIVTAEIAQMLDSYKREYESNMGGRMPLSLSLALHLALALIITLILFFAVYFGAPDIFSRKWELHYVVFVVFLAALPALILGRGQFPVQRILLMPMTLTALYLQAFFDDRLTVPVYLVALLPIAIIIPQGVALYLMFALAGLVAIKLFQRFNSGLKQFITALAIFLTLTLCYLALKTSGLLSGVVVRDIITIFISSLLTVAAYQLVFLFEKIFKLLSISRLEELSDTNNELLRALELKAPGTFQHSLQVMSMADSAARAIGANIYLLRAGALYHDIGKMQNPQCFVENESIMGTEGEEKYHSGLTPQQSSHDIIRHVSDGLELSDKYKLPKQVRDFILTHHGTSATTYFYNKFVNEGGDPAMLPEFTYPGRKPATREQTILMLCDSIEAASRTLKSYDSQSLSVFVDGIVKSKIVDGQLDESEISIKELNEVKNVLKNYIAQVHHERVAYPKRKK